MVDDLKIIELSSVLAGPAVGMFFAEMGAEVIKVENKKTDGDITRSWKLSTEPSEANPSAYFASVNWNKSHLFLDLSDEKDRKKVIDLIRTADVLISNFREGSAEKIGMDDTSLRKHNPTLVHAALKGFANDPGRTAYDVIMQAETGFMSMTGTPESGSVKMPVALIDLLAAHQMKEAILLGLLKKQKTGKGSYVETSLEATGIASLANQATNWLMNQQIPGRMGSLHPNIAPYGEIFPTGDDKEIVLAVGNDAQFQAMCNLLNTNLTEHSSFQNNQNRVSNRTELYEALAPHFLKWSRKELLEEFQKVNIPVGAIKNMKEVFEGKTASEMVLTETQEGRPTKRPSTLGFQFKNIDQDE